MSEADPRVDVSDFAMVIPADDVAEAALADVAPDYDGELPARGGPRPELHFELDKDGTPLCFQYVPRGAETPVILPVAVVWHPGLVDVMGDFPTLDPEGTVRALGNTRRALVVASSKASMDAFFAENVVRNSIGDAILREPIGPEDADADNAGADFHPDDVFLPMTEEEARALDEAAEKPLPPAPRGGRTRRRLPADTAVVTVEDFDGKTEFVFKNVDLDLDAESPA